MNPIKINITILLAKNRINSLGKCSLRCRITFHKIRHEFATGLFINPNVWNSKQQLAKPSNEENTFINNEISLIKNKINQAFLLLQLQGNEFHVIDIYNNYKGVTPKENIGVIFYYNSYLEKTKKLIGIEIKQSTWNKFNYILSDIKQFIKWKFNKNEILLKDLDYSFIVEFEYFLKTEKMQKQVTINKVLQRLKKVIKTAEVGKLINFNPFAEHKAKRTITTVIYLTPEELEQVENKSFSQPRLSSVRDLFIFCCYTGLAFNEMSNLEEKHIIEGFDGFKWIKMIREKTQKEISIPLLPKAREILSQQLGCTAGTKKYIFKTISNQKFNSYLKEIAEIVNIQKNLTHHTARKTFATTVLLYNDIPMEIVSELLGHSNITTTQEHYGKIVQRKVSDHMITLSKKLKG